MVRFFVWLFHLVFGRKAATSAAPPEPKAPAVAPLRQDDRDKSIVIRIDEETDEETDEESGDDPVKRHESEDFPVPTFTVHHHHF